MKISKVIVFFISLLIIGIVVYLVYLRPTPTPKPDPSFRLKAEQEVYFAMFAGHFAPEKYVAFKEYTTLGEYANFYPTLGVYSEPRWAEKISSLEHDTLKDFEEINKKSYLLKDYFPTNNNYLFVNDAEVEQFYNDENAFSNKHPNIKGIDSFSRVGFNSSLTQAMVLIETPRDGLIYLFKKTNDKWVEQEQIVIWIGD
jgi:hypothetical protein